MGRGEVHPAASEDSAFLKAVLMVAAFRHVRLSDGQSQTLAPQEATASRQKKSFQVVFQSVDPDSLSFLTLYHPVTPTQRQPQQTRLDRQ